MGFFFIISCSFKQPDIGTNIANISELYENDFTIIIKYKIPTRKSRKLNRNTKKDWKRVGSRRQEEGKKNQNRIQRVQRNGKNGGERTSINWTKGRTMVVFKRANPQIWMSSNNYTTAINPLINRICEAI